MPLGSWMSQRNIGAIQTLQAMLFNEVSLSVTLVNVNQLYSTYSDVSIQWPPQEVWLPG